MSIEIAPEQIIKGIIKQVSNLVDIPLNATMQQLGLNHSQLLRIQSGIARHFHHGVSIIYFSDTIYTLADRLNKKSERV